MSNLSSSIRFLAATSLVCVFLVILAGSVVRATGSGMGCPDWPKCYGYLVPPTDASAVEYVEGKSFNKGQMVILNDTLWVANAAIPSAGAFNRAEWHKYEKHNYARFDVTETWIEYINRLLGAFTGLPVFLLFVLSVLHALRHRDVYTFLLAGGTMLMLGFVAWLGKVVVDGNLKVGSITLHMLGSMVLILLLCGLLRRFAKNALYPAFNGKWKWATLALWVLLFGQILLGTQVREEVDVLAKAGTERALWIDQLSSKFIFHRSYSLLILALVGALFLWNQPLPRPLRTVRLLGALVAIEVLVGVVLAYVEMPKVAQPLHLLSALGMFGCTSYLLMLVFRRQLVV